MENIQYKFILIGNSGVGKTSIFKKLLTGKFIENNLSTIGVVNKKLNIVIDIEDNKNSKVKKEFEINLVDTAGQEQYRAVTYNYYRGSDGIILMYDITDEKSFKNVEIWVNSIREAIDNNHSQKYAIILVGNKLDLSDERQVNRQEAIDTSKKYNMIWGDEISTKDITKKGLDELFKGYVKEVYKAVGEKKIGKQKLQKGEKYKKKSKFKCFGI
jgi:small GTP-binding protein